MNIATSIVFVIIMLGVLATLHELGHYWVARLLKIKVYEVSIFVGPKLLRWKHKDVDFSLRLIPVGAYVRFTEIDEEGNAVDSKDPDLLVNQPRIKRLLVALAGPLMNLALGILIFFIMFCVFGFYSLEMGPAIPGTQTGDVATEFSEGDMIKKINGHSVFTIYDLNYEIDSTDAKEDMTVTLKSAETGKYYDVVLTPQVFNRPMLLINVLTTETENEYNGWEVYSVDPEQNKGNPVLEPGDYVTHINGVSVSDESFDEYIFNYTGDVLNVTYVRDGETYESEIIPEYVEYVSVRGIKPVGYVIDSPSALGKAFVYAAKMPAAIVNFTITGIRDIIAGKVKAYNLVSGPIGITSMVNDVVKDEEETTGDKIYLLIMLSAVISIALAYSNLLPIPGLDGVQILLIAVEMVIGRKLSEKAEGRLTVVGFVIIIFLVIFALVSDVLRIIFGY